MAKMDLTQVLVIVVVLAGAIQVFGVFDFGSLLAVSQTQPGSGQPTSFVCTGDVTPEISVSLLDEINPGTTRTDVNGVLYLNGQYGASQTLSSDAKFDAGANDSYVLYLINSTSTFNYYPTVIEGNVDCTELDTRTGTIKLAGALSTTVFNEDDVANTQAAPEPLGVGDSHTFRVRVKQSTNDAFWSGGYDELGIGIIVDYNNIATDEIQLSGLGGVTMTKIGNPSGHTSQDTTNALKTETYNTSVKELKDAGGQFEFNVNFVASGTHNPNQDSNVFIEVADAVLYQDAAGTWRVDYYDIDSLADLGKTNATDTIHYT